MKKQIPSNRIMKGRLFFYYCLLVHFSHFSSVAEEKDDELFRWLAAKTVTIPDCILQYETVWRRPASGGAVANPTNAAPGVLESLKFEMCKQGEMVYIKNFDEEGDLNSHLSFDGTSYFCYLSLAGVSHLWVGSAKGVIKAELFSKLLNSPHYAELENSQGQANNQKAPAFPISVRSLHHEARLNHKPRLVLLSLLSPQPSRDRLISYPQTSGNSSSPAPKRGI